MVVKTVSQEAKNQSKMLVINEAEIRRCVSLQDALRAAEKAFTSVSEKKVQQPAVMQLVFPDAEGELCVKSAHLGGSDNFAVKMASGFFRNAEKGLPSGFGCMLVWSARTGEPKALLADNGYLTDLRTGCAGALALRCLAPRTIRRVAVVGSGIQARYQLLAMRKVRSWTETAVFARNRERLDAYCAEMRTALGSPVRPASSVADAVRGADVIVLTTPSRSPLLFSEMVKPGATIIAVGSDTPGKQEVDARLVQQCRVVGDKLSQCRRLGELQRSRSEPQGGTVELGDVLCGKVAGRRGDEIILADLTGMGAQDAAIAEAALQAVLSHRDKAKRKPISKL